MEIATNAAGIDLIKTFESFSADVYRCPANVKTIGYGSTRFFDNRLLTGNEGSISKDEGQHLLRRDLLHAETMVARLVQVPVTENQFSALVSICQNIGSGNFQKSTFRMRLNRKDYAGCANNLWQYRRANGRILAGLVRRRESERKLFLTP